MWLLPFIKLITFLLVIPSTITFLHIRNEIQKSELCFVGPSPSPSHSSSLTLPLPLTLTLPSQSSGILSDFTVEDSSASASASARSGFIPSEFYGIYRPSASRSFHSKTIENKHESRGGGGGGVKHQQEQQHVKSNDSTTIVGINVWKTITNVVMQRHGYPSLLSLNYDLMNAAAAGYGNSNAMLSFDKYRQSWCFSNLDRQACLVGDQVAGTGASASASASAGADAMILVNDVHIFPPSGPTILILQSEASESKHQQQQQRQYISISCPGQYKYSYFSTAWWKQNFQGDPGFRKNPNSRTKNRSTNPNLQFLQRPTTTILILINLALAYIYWSKRIDPSLVCKEYQKIVYENELWRSVSSYTYIPVAANNYYRIICVAFSHLHLRLRWRWLLVSLANRFFLRSVIRRHGTF